MKTVPALLALMCLAGAHVSDGRAAVPTAPAVPAMTRAAYHLDGILGTSADFTFVSASPRAADRAERVAVAEIERLRRVLSSWHDRSELAQLFATGALEHPSAELRTVLAQYTVWQARSAGAYSPRVGELAALAGHQCTRRVGIALGMRRSGSTSQLDGFCGRIGPLVPVRA